MAGFRSSGQRFGGWKNFTARIAARDWLWIAIGFVLLLALVLVLVLQKKPDIATSSAFNVIRDRGVVRIGVQSDLPKFSYPDDSGQLDGLDIDIAHAIAARIFDGDASKVELVPVTLNTRIPKLDKGFTDCTLAIIPADISTKALYSRPYYVDTIGMLVRENDAADSIGGLNTRKIGVIARPSVASKALTGRKAVEEALSSKHISADIVEYTSIPDMLDALSAGAIDGAALEYSLISAYFIPDYKLLAEAVAKIPYCVAVPAGNETMLTLVNDVLKKLEDSGELKALWDKRSLIDYR